MRNRQPRVGPVIVTGWIDIHICQRFPRSVLTMVEKRFLKMTCHCNFFESNKPQPTCSLQHVHCSPRSKLNIHKFSFFSFSHWEKRNVAVCLMQSLRQFNAVHNNNFTAKKFMIIIISECIKFCRWTSICLNVISHCNYHSIFTKIEWTGLVYLRMLGRGGSTLRLPNIQHCSPRAKIVHAWSNQTLTFFLVLRRAAIARFHWQSHCPEDAWRGNILFGRRNNF